MKVLSIGNSFSQDAHKWLHRLAELNGVEMETLNLCNSGCDLQRHYKHIQNNLPNYAAEPNGGKSTGNTTMEDALKLTDWDVVTIQQVSGKSGVIDTYEPYLSELVAVIRKHQPNAEIWMHQSWAYEQDVTDHPQFAEYYDNSQQKMFDAIVETTQKVAATIPAKIIPAGELIQKIRTTVPEFDYANGGKSLNRDGYHMTLDYGRFAVAALWLRTLTGITVKAETFEDFDPALLQKILAVVNTQ